MSEKTERIRKAAHHLTHPAAGNGCVGCLMGYASLRRYLVDRIIDLLPRLSSGCAYQPIRQVYSAKKPPSVLCNNPYHHILLNT